MLSFRRNDFFVPVLRGVGTAGVGVLFESGEGNFLVSGFIDARNVSDSAHSRTITSTREGHHLAEHKSKKHRGDETNYGIYPPP